jgi:hypothetical protein
VIAGAELLLVLVLVLVATVVPSVLGLRKTSPPPGRRMSRDGQRHDRGAGAHLHDD